MKKIVSKILNIISIILITVIIVFIAVIMFQKFTGKEPNVFGYKIYEILTDSMTPELKPKDIIISKNCDYKDLKEGDIITFEIQTGSLKGYLNTHKIIKSPYELDGKIYVQTQGTKTGAKPDDPIEVQHIRGKFVRRTVVIGKIFQFIKKPIGFVTIIAIPIIMLMIGQVMNIVKAKNQVIKEEAESKIRKFEDLSEEEKQKMIDEYKKQNKLE